MTDPLSRRVFLVQGLAAAGAATVVDSLAGAAVGRGRALQGPAAASGVLRIGGDLPIHRIGLGTTEFTNIRGGLPAADPAALRALLRRAIDLGVNFIDCADDYGSGYVDGLCERIIYDALYPYPRDLVIATKGGQVRSMPAPGAPFTQVLDGRPEHLRAACEASLRRLRLEQIPLYYLHQPDPKVPYEDSLGELARLQKQGLIRHIGISNVSSEQFEKARSIVTVCAVQNQYNILDQTTDPILNACDRAKIAFIPFSPLGGRSAKALNASDTRLAKLHALATKRHIEFPQIVLAWLLARSPVMVAIPGTTKIEHLEGNVAAGRVKLTREEMAEVG